MDGFVRRLALLFALASCLAAAPPGKSEFVHAVEFPYYLYPRALWERELVWLKTVGVTTVTIRGHARAIIPASLIPGVQPVITITVQAPTERLTP